MESDDRSGSTSSRAVTGYASLVAVLGLTVAAVVAVLQVRSVDWTSGEMRSSYVLTALLFFGELRRMRVVRSDGDTDRLTVSSTFAVALVMIGPLFLALAAQLLATGLDDVRRRRRWLVVGFNLGQYALTLSAVRIAFSWPQHESVLGLHPFTASDAVLPALFAALTYFVVNNTVVGGVVALDSGTPVLEVLREDLRVQGMSSAILLGLAPVAAVISSDSLLLVPLLVLPLLGVQRNAWIAAQRQHESLHDELTGLPNRSLFRLRAERALQTAAAKGRKAAIMLVDLDHFKEVNDTLGHHVGDGLLREVATRLSTSLPDGITVARLGGDEFAILVPDAADASTSAALGELVMTRLREPLMAEGVRIGVHASIGVACYPDHAGTVDLLLQRADVALYRAKSNRGELQVYHRGIDPHTVQRLSLLGDLHAAADNGEFHLAFQPQVASDTGEVTGIEALLRWQHPVHGNVPPDDFIPLAENSGVINQVTRFAVGSSLTVLRDLRDAGHDLAVAVNLSPRLLSDLELPTWLGALLQSAGVPADRLTVEVTESSITADPRRAMQVLDELREMGLRLSIDDFGTGYSSLSYLRRLRPQEIKIDRSFVLQMRREENSAVIVRSTIDLAHGLGMSVVAEGVEDQATFDALATLGCDAIQGYHVARPMVEVALHAWLAQHGVHRGPSWMELPSAGSGAGVVPFRRQDSRQDRSALA